MTSTYGKELGSTAGASGLGERPVDSDRRFVGPTLPESQQRQPRLRIPTGITGLSIAGLRVVDVAAQPMQLALLVYRGTVEQLSERLGEPGSG
jgi:hypothetical protein